MILDKAEGQINSGNFHSAKENNTAIETQSLWMEDIVFLTIASVCLVRWNSQQALNQCLNNYGMHILHAPADMFYTC